MNLAPGSTRARASPQRPPADRAAARRAGQGVALGPVRPPAALRANTASTSANASRQGILAYWWKEIETQGPAFIGESQMSSAATAAELEREDDRQPPAAHLGDGRAQGVRAGGRGDLVLHLLEADVALGGEDAPRRRGAGRGAIARVSRRCSVRATDRAPACRGRRRAWNTVSRCRGPGLVALFDRPRGSSAARGRRRGRRRTRRGGARAASASHRSSASVSAPALQRLLQAEGGQDVDLHPRHHAQHAQADPRRLEQVGLALRVALHHRAVGASQAEGAGKVEIEPNVGPVPWVPVAIAPAMACLSMSPWLASDSPAPTAPRSAGGSASRRGPSAAAVGADLDARPPGRRGRAAGRRSRTAA